jgi:hypothetical protein
VIYGFGQPNEYLFDPNKIYRQHAICRTALLPLQVASMPGLREKGTPVLIFDPAERQQCEGLNFDCKDYFAIRKLEGGVSFSIPNDADIEAFAVNRNLTNPVMIMLCQRKCLNSLCPPNIVGLHEISAGVEKMSVLVNKQPVVKAMPFEDCHFLANDAGLEWGRSDGFGRYSLRFMSQTGDIKFLQPWLYSDAY